MLIFLLPSHNNNFIIIQIILNQLNQILLDENNDYKQTVI
jgi:hypothetical protein